MVLEIHIRQLKMTNTNIQMQFSSFQVHEINRTTATLHGKRTTIHSNLKNHELIPGERKLPIRNGNSKECLFTK